MSATCVHVFVCASAPVEKRCARMIVREFCTDFGLAVFQDLLLRRDPLSKRSDLQALSSRKAQHSPPGSFYVPLHSFCCSLVDWSF